MKENEARENNLESTAQKDYKRDVYDDTGKREDFKKSAFNKNKTIEDDYSENKFKLHSSLNAAQAKYGKNKYTSHSSDVDHIIPLKEIHSKHKHNPFLNDSDIKEIGNISSNLKITSSKFNRTKGSSSNLRVITTSKMKTNNQVKIKLARDHFYALGSTNLKAAGLSAKNITKDFYMGSKTAINVASLPLIVSTASNLYQVASGDKQIDEAIIDVGVITAKTASYGGMIKITQKVTHKALNKLMSSNSITQLVYVAHIIGESGFKLINGQISHEKFIEETIESGTGFLAATVGSFAGQLLIPIPVAGAIIGSMVSTIVCSVIINKTKQAITAINNGFKTVNRDARKLSAVNALADEALKEMQKQRDILKTTIEHQFAQWDSSFESGFDLIINGSLENNPDIVASGLDEILQVLEKNVKFKTLEEFNDFFECETAVLKL